MVENRARRWIVTDFIIGACFYEFSVHQYEPVSREYKENSVTLTKVKHLHFCAFRAFCVNLNEHECRYDTQSTQMGADYAEKVTRKVRKSRKFFLNTNLTNEHECRRYRELLASGHANGEGLQIKAARAKRQSYESC